MHPDHSPSRSCQVMSQRDQLPQEGSQSTTFPISSPSFWDEAAKVPTRSRSKSPADVKNVDRINSTEGSETNDRGDAKTTLSYLPNRLDPFLDDDPHAYLANPEYAPNRFGDIGDYMRKKEIKVQTQNRDIARASAAEGTPQIFAKISFYINGNTHPPMEELRKMILQRGGEVRPVLRNKGMVKFIIAPMLTQSKFKQFERYRVVREGWITESCKEGKLLDWSRWKLQIQGGWEEGSRKGLEGFLGTQSPAAFEDEIKTTRLASPEEKPETGQMASEEINIAPAPIALTASTQSLLRPVTCSIPISPGRVRAETPMKEPVPAKVQRPEGGWWEHYYSKDSNEEAARLLKDREWRLKNTAERGNEGGFIDGYYQNSRLHHLSTWKAELRVLVAAAQQQSEQASLTQPSSQTVSPFTLSTARLPRAAQVAASTGAKVLFHVDFDCFFVSCGLATRPHLKGKPAVVCHSQAGNNASSTSEIASASYEARAKGVKNGMSLGRARTLVGEGLQTIPYEFDTYKKFSLAFYTVLMGYADELQAVSVDEALIDVTSAVSARAMAPEEALEIEGGDGAPLDRDPAVEIAEKIRDDVRKLTDGCEVSIGIASNVLLAKLATRRAKPAGVHHVFPHGVPALLAPLDVEDLPSIGYSMRGKIEEKFGTTICGELLSQSKGSFRTLLGPKTGEMLWGYLRGLDDRKLEPHKERKSISAEMNYGIRFQSQDQAETCMIDLAAEVAKRMRQVNARGRLLTLKVMSRHPEAPLEPPKFLGHGWCETFNKSSAIANKGGSATDDAEILGVEAVKLLRAMKLDPKELRGVGIQITKLDSDKPPEREAGQGTLAFGTKRKREVSEADAFSEVRSARASHCPSPKPVLAPKMPVVSVPQIPTKDSGEVHPPLTRQRVRQQEAVAGPSRLPDSEGIDPDFLAALPPELQVEVKEIHARTRAQSSAPPDVSPSKAKGQHAAAHITRQLRPKVKTQMKASAVAELPLYGAWAKARDREDSIDLTVGDDGEIGAYRRSALREMSIDPEVFSALPEELQKEVFDEEQRKHQQRQALHRPADRLRLKAKQRESTRTASVSPSRSSKAGSAAPPPRPLVAIAAPTRPALLKATALPDVLDTVTRWIDSRNGGSPADKDVNKVKTYLLKSAEPLTGGLSGLENAVEVLKWLRLEITTRWGSEDEAEGQVGSDWWNVWADLHAQVDAVAARRYGAGVRLL